MRHYHLVWIHRLASIAFLTGFVFLGLSWFDANHQMLYMKIGVPALLAGCLPSMLIQLWLSFKQGSNLQAPNCPEGLPVEPSGIWVDDDITLQVGTRILALSQGFWHRAVVIRIKRRNRVLVHYIGWDSFWDEVFPRLELQVDPSALTDDAPRFDRSSETAIRERSRADDNHTLRQPARTLIDQPPPTPGDRSR